MPPTELPLPTDDWTVEAVRTKDKADLPIPDHLITWQLCYRGNRQIQMKGPNARRTLTDTAQQRNKARVTPTKHKRCYADEAGESCRSRAMLKNS